MPKQASAKPFGEPAPVIVRVAGLPLETVQRFASGLCDAIAARTELDARLAAARADLVEWLHREVPHAPPELRRFLLALKRDCHNGRPVHTRTGDPRWEEVRGRGGRIADEVVTLDREGAELDARFDADYTAELERQRRAVLEPLENAGFRRGLALASPDLSDAARLLPTTPSAAYGRRERKAELSLLRYVTRAATKVSPFSTFTAVALGRLRRDTGAGGLRLEGEPWRERSLVRVKRYLLHRVVEVLCGYQPFRGGLRVELNDSLSETAPGRFVYLRPHHWEMDDQGVLRYHKDAIAAAGLGGALISRLSDLLAGERPTYRELLEALAREFPASGEAGVREHVDRLLELGVLQLLMPWPAYEGHLEKRMLEHLRTLPADPVLEPLVHALARLVSLEDGYASTPDPARSIRGIERAVDEVGAAAAPLGGLEPSAVVTPRPGLFSIYEDVFLSPADEDGRAPREGVATMRRGAATEALRSAELLVRLSVLFDHRRSFGHTLASVARERSPGRADAGVLEVLREVQPLWHDYMKVHYGHWRDRGNAPVTWNPLDLPELDQLHHWRTVVSDRLPGCARMEEGRQHFCPDLLRSLLDEVPASFTDARGWGATLMIQPASTDGSLWMLNRLREGTGRYGSRYTPVMDSATREWYTAHLAARGTYELDGERVELLDVHCVHGDTINVHYPQTPALLTMPDDEADLAPHRRVRLSDLRIAFGDPGALPTLRHRGGQRYLPVNLGIAFEAYMPTLLKFLCLFGPSELGTVLPPRAYRKEGPVVVGERASVGSLVVQRRSWKVSLDVLRELLAERDDARAFAAVNRFRMRWDIPERVFFWDMLLHDFFKKTYKPQYLDFTSPLFLPLLRGVVEDGEDLRLTELLPTPEMCPRDGAGRTWAVEVLLDSLTLRRPHPGAAAPGERARPGAPSPPVWAGERPRAHRGSQPKETLWPTTSTT